VLSLFDLCFLIDWELTKILTLHRAEELEKAAALKKPAASKPKEEERKVFTSGDCPITLSYL
jgi:hypothetical protein